MNTKMLFAAASCAALGGVTLAAKADENPGPAPAAAPAPAPAEKADAKESWVEPGRFGLVAAVTEDGIQAGFTRVGEHYEVTLTADSSWAFAKNSTALSGDTGDLGLTLRGGPRFRLGHLNYLSLGAQAAVSLFGQDNGVSTEGSWTMGPYIGVHRNFAGTPLMISLWVLPYEFQHVVSNDGSGKQVYLNNHEFFQGGGFGLSYLF